MVREISLFDKRVYMSLSPSIKTFPLQNELYQTLLRGNPSSIPADYMPKMLHITAEIFAGKPTESEIIRANLNEVMKKFDDTYPTMDPMRRMYVKMNLQNDLLKVVGKEHDYPMTPPRPLAHSSSLSPSGFSL